MSKNKKLPGVDEKALGELAKQFPGSQPQAPQTEKPAEKQPEMAAAATPSVPKKADTAKAKTSTAKAAGPSEPAPDAAPVKAEKPSTVTPPTPPAAAPAPSAAPAPRRGRGLALLSLLISLCALVLALAILSPPELRPWLQSKIASPRIVDFLTGARFATDQRLSEADAALTSLRSRLDDITARVGGIEAVGGSNEAAARRVIAVENGLLAVNTMLAGNGAKIETIDDTLSDARNRVGDLETRQEQAAVRTDVLTGNLDSLTATLVPRLDGFEQTLQKLETQSVGPQKLFLYALKIRLAMQTSLPFLKDVSAAQALPGNTPAISAALQTLAGLATTGAPTLAQLRTQFNQRLAPRLRGAGQPVSRTFVGRMGNWVDGLLSDPATATSAETANLSAIIELAQESLAQNDLATAIERLGQLKGVSKVITAEWIKDARNRLSMDQSVSVLMTAAFDQLVSKN
ncbi:MAG: hypothetical protein HQ483_07705 [Rhodospirillales bacterium]|nr:hypothetical protein [Rhodospirillales bacterium]